jgi:hypothetical protein
LNPNGTGNVTPILNRITFSYTGNTPTFLNRQSFTLPNVPNGLGSNERNNFGDIAITSAGLLFGVTNADTNATGRLFRLNLTTLTETAINNSYQQIDGDIGQGGLQTGFSPLYDILYANNANKYHIKTCKNNAIALSLSTAYTTSPINGNTNNHIKTITQNTIDVNDTYRNHCQYRKAA